MSAGWSTQALFGAGAAGDVASSRLLERFEGWRAILGRRGDQDAAQSAPGPSGSNSAAQRLERDELSELRRLKRRTGVGGPGKIGRDGMLGRAKALRQEAGGRHGGSASTKAMGLRASLAGQANGAQAAVVKVSGYGAGAKAARSMLDYNSRKAELPLETERGEVLTTREQRNRMLSEWEPFYDNRKPSDDVATMTLRWRGGDAPDAAKVEEWLQQALAGHRLAIGVGRSGDDGVEATIVFALARREGRRLSWTEAGQSELARRLGEGASTGETMTAPQISFGAAGHGPDAGIVAKR